MAGSEAEGRTRHLAALSLLLLTGSVSASLPWPYFVTNGAFCGGGYQQLGTTCLYRVAAGYTREQAASVCSGAMLRVAYARDQTELSSLSNYDANSLWLNAEVNEDGNFSWVNERPTLGGLNSGTETPLSEWASSKVTDRAADRKCLRTGASSMIRTTDCTDKRQVMCVTVADAGCPAGFLRTGSACVYGSLSPASFSEARHSCRSLMAELYEPREPGLLADVRELTAKAAPTDHWVGVEEKYPGDYRFSSDGGSPRFLLFSETSSLGPVPASSGSGSCVKMAADGQLLLAECSERNNFFCLYKPRPLCPPGFISFGESSDCFYIVDRHSVTQEEGQKRCAAVGATLADIREQSILTNFKDWQNDESKRLWVGITDKAENNLFTSADGLVPALLPWASGEGTDDSLGCTTLHSSAMVDASCAAEQADGYMCLHSPAPDSCPAGFLELGGRCYRYSSTVATYVDASAACQKLASSLARIDTAETARMLSSTVLWDQPSYQWLVGLKLNSLSSQWQNYDDTITTNDVWDTTPSGQDCAVLAESEGKELLTPVACSNSFKYICEWQSELVNDVIPSIDPDGACFLDEPYPSDPDFRVSPGDYNPTLLNPSICKVRCLSLQFMYAGVKNGMFCFCSSILRIERVAAAMCSVPCSDNSGQTCGGDGEYVQVYRTGGKADIQGVSIEVEEKYVQPVDTLFTFKTAFEVGEQVLVSYDFGDGSDATKPVLSEEASTMTYQYGMPGIYTVTAIFTDVPGVAKPRYQQTTVTVGEEVGQVELDCPDVSEPGEEFSCQLWLVTGSQLKLTVEMDKGFTEGTDYTLPDQSVRAVGQTPPQQPTTDLMVTAPSFRRGQHAASTLAGHRNKRSVDRSGFVPQDSTFHSNTAGGGASVDSASGQAVPAGQTGESYDAKTVIMTWAKVTDPLVLVGFEYYAVKEGTIKLMVFRPTCDRSSFCFSSGACDSGHCGDVDPLTVSCEASDPFYAPLRQCRSSVCGSATTAPLAAADGNSSSPLGDGPGYTAVYSVTEQVAAVGYGKLLVDSGLKTATWLQPGDVFGYTSDGAVLGWRPARLGEESELGTQGGSAADAASSGELRSRHYLRALVSSPLQLTVSHTYDLVGAYQISATVATTGDITAETSAGQVIDVQVPITGFRVTLDPEHVTTNNKTNVTVYIKAGSFVKITFDFGETHLGGKTEVIQADIIDDDGWSHIYWYKLGDPGPRYVIITAENKMGKEQFRHTLYVQRPVTDKWYLVDNAPVLWPVPGDVNFTVVYPVGLVLPTMASAQLFTGDGYVFEWEIPEERQANEIYEIGFNRTYEKEGAYRAMLRIFNLASEFEMTNRVPVWAEIKNLTTMAYYLPFLPIGGDIFTTGHGPEYNSFPIERNVSFFLNMTQGKVFQYILEMDNGTFLTNASTSPVDFIFPEPGTYSVSLYGWNPLQGRSTPVNTTVKILESAVNVIIDDYLMVSEAKSAKEFEIRMVSIGTYACLIWNPGDGSKLHGFGDRDTCRDEYPEGSFIFDGKNIQNPMPMQWVYNQKGESKMSVHAFNFLSASRYELQFTVSSIPCRPPDLMIRDNSTEFWKPKEFLRKDPIQLFTFCNLDCNASLETTKTWTAVKIDESWGTEIESVALTSLSSHQKSFLFLPARFLEYGTYKMVYRLQISGEGMEPGQPFIKRVFTYIRIKRSPLVVTMVAGGSSAIQRGYNQMVLLEPDQYSMDPDYPDDKDLVYSWFCRRLPDETLPRTRSGWLRHTEPRQNPIMNVTAELYDWVYDNTTNTTYEVERPDLGGCFGQGPGMLNITGGRLELNTLQFRTNNVTYEISVQMRKADLADPRQTAGTTLVEVVAGSPPLVTVKCQVADMCRVTESGSIINPSSRVALVGFCEELCDGALRWSWRIHFIRNNTEYRISDGDKYIIGVGKESVAIKKALYSAYPDVVEFRVKLSVMRMADGERGVATMYLLLNQAPLGGTCRVTPPDGRVVNLLSQGVPATGYDPAAGGGAQADNGTAAASVELPIPGRALTEDWHVECTNFKDPEKDRIGKYLFFIKHPSEGFTRVIKFGKERMDRFVFPYGVWELWVTINDNFDASRDIFIDTIMTSTPTKGEYAAWERKKEVPRAMGEGDQPRLSQLLMALSSLQEIELPDDPTETTTTPAYEYYDDDVEAETMDPEELLEIQAEQERQRLETLDSKATENRQMLSQLDNLNQNTLDDCTMALGATAAIVGDGKAVDSTAKDLAIEAIGGKCLQEVLLNSTINDPKQAEGMATSSLGSVTAVGKGIDNTNLDGEIVPSDMMEARRRRSTDYPEYDLCEEGEGEPDPHDPDAPACKTATQLALMVPAMMESVKLMQDKLMSIVLPGEDPFTVKTADGLEMTLVMMEGWALSGYRMRLGEGEYQFPDLCAVLHEEPNCSAAFNMTVGLQTISWPTLLYSYGEGTEAVSRDSANLQLKLVQQLLGTTELEQLPVYDLPSHQRVRITVPRGKKGAEPVLPDPTFVEPQPNAKEIMVYHSFNVSHPYVAINVEVSVSRPDAQLVVFMKRGNKPNLTQYDWVWKIQLPTNFTVDVSEESIEEPIPLTTAVPLTTIRVPFCEELEGVNATRGTNQTCIPGGISEPPVICEEDLITFGSTTPAPATETTPLPELHRSTGGPNSTAGWSGATTEGRVCTPVVVTSPASDGDSPDARPVQPTNYISEYVRLRVVPNRALEPYDPHGNDTLLYSYPLYDIFVPDWYVDNMTGEYWIGVAEFSNTTDDEVFFDDPSSVNLTFSNMTHVYSTNYTVRVYTSGCLFYNTLSESWDSDGCTVLLTAMLVSAVCKKLDDGHDDIDDDEKEPELQSDEEWIHAPRKKKKDRKLKYRPADPAKIEAAKRERQKEVKMWDILQEMAAYAFFLWVLLTISYGSRDPNCFLIRQSLENHFLQPRDHMLSFHAVRNASRFWNWTRSVMVPQLKIDTDYSGQKPRGREKNLISDRVHLLLGNGVMRQVRVQDENTCTVPKLMRNITRDCHKFGNLLFEEGRDFGLGWNASLARTRPFNQKEYRHRSASSLDSYPFWGDLGWYGGGGYVVDLKGSRARLISEMSRLQAQRWVDEKTRAVFIEFSLFNAQVNLFVGCTIAAEFGPDGSVTPFFKFQPVRLFNYNSGFGLFVLICDVTFVIFIIYYTVREVKRARKHQGQYLEDPWNYLELAVIVLGYTSIVFYLYRLFMASRIVDSFEKTRGRGYIKLQFVTYLDETFGYMIGFLVFFATLKFIKLLRFNKRMGFLTSTLKQCAGDLVGFIVIFFVIFASFSSTFFLLFGSAMADFSNLMVSVESSFAMMLGKFNFMAMCDANRIIGPIMFFTFTISMTSIFINIFLTIIIKSFQAVKLDLMKQSNDYEVIEFLVNRAKLVTGIGKPKLNNVGPLVPTDPDEANKDPSHQFPEKVDQLLSHVNDFYFDGKMNLNNKAWLKKTLKVKKKGSSGGIQRYDPPELTENQQALTDI